MEIISQESPQLLFVDAQFVDLVQKIMLERWNNFNTPLHTLAHALNPRFYDKDLIAQSYGKRKATHKDREVANGVKKALTRMFLADLHREVKEEFASFAARLDDYSDISALDERSTMNPVSWWIFTKKMVYICKPLPFVFFHKWQALHQQKGIGAPMVLFTL